MTHRREAPLTAGWRSRATLPPRPQPIEVRKREKVCTLRKGEHRVALEKRPVFGVGEELILGGLRAGGY